MTFKIPFISNVWNGCPLCDTPLTFFGGGLYCEKFDYHYEIRFDSLHKAICETIFIRYKDQDFFIYRNKNFFSIQKYEPIQKWIKVLKSNDINISFKNIEKNLGKYLIFQ